MRHSEIFMILRSQPGATPYSGKQVITVNLFHYLYESLGVENLHVKLNYNWKKVDHHCKFPNNKMQHKQI